MNDTLMALCDPEKTAHHQTYTLDRRRALTHRPPLPHTSCTLTHQQRHILKQLKSDTESLSVKHLKGSADKIEMQMNITIVLPANVFFEIIVEFVPEGAAVPAGVEVVEATTSSCREVDFSYGNQKDTVRLASYLHCWEMIKFAALLTVSRKCHDDRILTSTGAQGRHQQVEKSKQFQFLEVIHSWNNNLLGNTKVLVLDMTYEGQSGAQFGITWKASPSLASPSPSILEMLCVVISPQQREEVGGQGPDKVKDLDARKPLKLLNLGLLEPIHFHKEVRSPRVSQKPDGAWRTICDVGKASWYPSPSSQASDEVQYLPFLLAGGSAWPEPGSATG
ncbi:hypothetical protein Celaphus_00002402 [Cervus elaphus hippelaphus]|uniref:Uncharacterized protein n=1 Tax=Cervus elaphus hippelaphus TaxID=46360 RepID=A0A212CGX8_CEREH|nr:hypothetical protein Celaphus_00002402 [Cervus elaphus hippelaphus]